MNGCQAIQSTLESNKGILNWYVGDFTDAEMFVRPIPEANHAAWQIGHIILGDVYLIKEELPEAVYPELPAGFVEIHSKAGAIQEGPEGFLPKAEMLKLWDEVRAATIATVGKLTDADLDKPTTGSMKGFAKTHGELFLMMANHTLMHAGQFSVTRRKLGKPVLF